MEKDKNPLLKTPTPGQDLTKSVFPLSKAKKRRCNPWDSIFFRAELALITALTAVGVAISWGSSPFAIPFVLIGGAGAILYAYKRSKWPNC